MQICFVMPIFLLFSNQFFFGGGGKFPEANCLREKPAWFGVIVQIWHPVLESGSKKDTLSRIRRPKSIP